MSLIRLVDEEPLDFTMSDATFISLMVIGAAILAAVLIVAFAVWLNKFQRELRRVNTRIQNADSERERQHYLRRRRNLFLSIIPFVKYKRR